MPGSLVGRCPRPSCVHGLLYFQSRRQQLGTDPSQGLRKPTCTIYLSALPSALANFLYRSGTLLLQVSKCNLTDPSEGRVLSTALPDTTPSQPLVTNAQEQGGSSRLLDRTECKEQRTVGAVLETELLFICFKTVLLHVLWCRFLRESTDQ